MLILLPLAAALVLGCRLAVLAYDTPRLSVYLELLARAPLFWAACYLLAFLIVAKVLLTRLLRFPGSIADEEASGGASSVIAAPDPWEDFAAKANPRVNLALIVAWVFLLLTVRPEVGLALTFPMLLLVAFASVAREVLKVQKARRTLRQNVDRAKLDSYLPFLTMVALGVGGLVWSAFGRGLRGGVDVPSSAFWAYFLVLATVYRWLDRRSYPALCQRADALLTDQSKDWATTNRMMSGKPLNYWVLWPLVGAAALGCYLFGLAPSSGAAHSPSSTLPVLMRLPFRELQTQYSATRRVFSWQFSVIFATVFALLTMVIHLCTRATASLFPEFLGVFYSY